jgi:hypothetical protein
LERHHALAGHWQFVYPRVDPIYDSFRAMATTLTSSAAPMGADFSYGGAVLLVRNGLSSTYSTLPHERTHVE